MKHGIFMSQDKAVKTTLVKPKGVGTIFKVSVNIHILFWTKIIIVVERNVDLSNNYT